MQSHHIGLGYGGGKPHQEIARADAITFVYANLFDAGVLQRLDGFAVTIDDNFARSGGHGIDLAKRRSQNRYH